MVDRDADGDFFSDKFFILLRHILFAYFLDSNCLASKPIAAFDYVWEKAFAYFVNSLVFVFKGEGSSLFLKGNDPLINDLARVMMQNLQRVLVDVISKYTEAVEIVFRFEILNVDAY